ncbi:hypothetical protein VPHD529_0002 [Vibrio phage D529]
MATDSEIIVQGVVNAGNISRIMEIVSRVRLI